VASPLYLDDASLDFYRTRNIHDLCLSMVIYTVADSSFKDLFWQMFYDSASQWCDDVRLFECKDSDPKGYYSLQRYENMPEDDDVLVCDIDIKFHYIDPLVLSLMLDRYETITLARKKIENGKLGGQMAILFRKDIIPFVKAYALSVKDKSTWGTSKSIKKWIVNNTAHTHFHCTYDAYLNENMHPKWIAFARGTNKPKLQPSVKFECLNSI
jgi:hypothetical protein